MNKYFLFLMVMLYSCGSARCPVNKNIINEFRQKIELIRSAEEKNTEVYTDDRFKHPASAER